MTYFFHPSAESEHLESVAFYETKRAGLGASYLAEFEAPMSAIYEFPHRIPIEEKPDIRRIKLDYPHNKPMLRQRNRCEFFGLAALHFTVFIQSHTLLVVSTSYDK